MLRRIIRAEGDGLTNGIIFCNRKVDVDILAKSLKRHGFDAQAMHGDLDQKLRMKILQAFRDGELKLLIASDVAARGLDIPNVSHIFNFDVPIHSEDYVHRIGRTGRAGRSGTSITLCLPSEEKYLAKIEELVKKPIPAMESPLGSRRRASRAPREPRAPAAAQPQAPRAQPPRRPPPRAAGAAAEPRSRAPSRRRAAPRAPRPAAREPAARRRAEAPRRARRTARAVQGMGDHVPAFLMRELRVEPDAARPSRCRNRPTRARSRSEPARRGASPPAKLEAARRAAQAPATASRRRRPPPDPRALAFAAAAVANGRRRNRQGAPRWRPDFDRELEERLVRYAAIDTQSDEASPTCPAPSDQFDLLSLLVDELQAIGAADVR